MSLQSCWKAAAVAAVADSLPTAAVAAVANSLPTAVAAAVADNLPRSIVWSWGDIDNPHTVWPIDLNRKQAVAVLLWMFKFQRALSGPGISIRNI